MTTAVIIGIIVVGFLAGWLLCRRMYDRHLLAADKERCQLIESLAKSDAIVSMQTKTIEGLNAENQQLKLKLERIHSEPDSFVG